MLRGHSPAGTLQSEKTAFTQSHRSPFAQSPLPSVHLPALQRWVACTPLPFTQDPPPTPTPSQALFPLPWLTRPFLPSSSHSLCEASGVGSPFRVSVAPGLHTPLPQRIPRESQGKRCPLAPRPCPPHAPVPWGTSSRALKLKQTEVCPHVLNQLTEGFLVPGGERITGS